MPLKSPIIIPVCFTMTNKVNFPSPVFVITQNLSLNPSLSNYIQIFLPIINVNTYSNLSAFSPLNLQRLHFM